MAISRRTFLASSLAGAAAGATLAAEASDSAKRNFQFEEGRRYLMPAHFGPPLRGKSSYHYRDVTTFSVSYRTDPDKLIRYLPEPFEVRQPILTVFYQMCRQVDWMAGANYNLLGVNAAVRFNGKNDQIDGQFCLVLWENDTDPILRGRELQGIPKIFADIEDPAIIDGTWNTNASLRGHKIVDVELSDLSDAPDATLESMRESMKDSNWMGWKYVPKTGANGADVSYATLYPTSSAPERVRFGKGSVQWHELTWEQNPTQAHIANALAGLPILEYGPAVVIEGPTALYVEGRPVRPLS